MTRRRRGRVHPLAASRPAVGHRAAARRPPPRRPVPVARRARERVAAVAAVGVHRGRHPGRRRAAPGRRRRSASWASGRRRARRRSRRCPAATSRRCCSRARCSRSPRCCSPRSPRRAWTWAPASRSTGCCARSPRPARAVVVQSSDALELHGLCDRVHVFSNGAIVRTLEGDAFGGGGHHGRRDRRRGGRAGRRRRWRHAPRACAGSWPATTPRAPRSPCCCVLIALYTGANSDAFFTERNFQSMLLLTLRHRVRGAGPAGRAAHRGHRPVRGRDRGHDRGAAQLLRRERPGAGDARRWASWSSPPWAWRSASPTRLLIRKIGLNPVIATLSTFIVLQGIALLLRPKPGGTFDRGIVGVIKTNISGRCPSRSWWCVALTIVAELVLRRTRAGVGLRAVGSNEHRAFRLGAPVGRLEVGRLRRVRPVQRPGRRDARLARWPSAMRAWAPTTRSSPSPPSSWAAPASWAAGARSSARSWARCCIQEIVTASGFLRLGTAWQQWVPGVIVLVAAAISSRSRSIRRGSRRRERHRPHPRPTARRRSAA